MRKMKELFKLCSIKQGENESELVLHRDLGLGLGYSRFSRFFQLSVSVSVSGFRLSEKPRFFYTG